MLKRLWQSTTVTTWSSYSAQALNIIIVLPLVLKKFNAENVVLWYLFSTIISLLSIADFGFRTTFSRNISYALGGATQLTKFIPSVVTNGIKNDNRPNLILLHRIVSTMKIIYVWLTVILFIVMGIFGTWAMIKPINSTDNISQAWLCWVIVGLGSCVRFYGKIYMNFLEGLFKIAIVRRIETLTSLGSIFSSIAVLVFVPSLLNLVAVTQFWVLVVTFRDWYLCRRVDRGVYKKVSRNLPFDKDIFMAIWKPAWRSGIASFMSVGLTNLTGVVYAQVGTSASVASYLMAFRLIDQIKIVSMAPLYSKFPLLARLRVQNNMAELIKIVRRNMLLSHLSFVLGFALIGIFSNDFLYIIHSKVSFVSQKMWILLGIAFFVHRYGAMHIQVYLSTNHIISHIADGISGIIYILSAFILKKYIGEYAIPIAMLIGYLGFYSWYAARYSYKSLNIGFWSFEKQTSFIPLIIMICYVIIYLRF